MSNCPYSMARPRLWSLLVLGALAACGQPAPPPPAPAPTNIVKQTEADVNASIKANTEALDRAIEAQSTGTGAEPPK